MTTAESVGQRIKRLRLENGLSQRALSAPGISYAYISRIEAGTRQPSVKALRKIAGKLGVTPEYLETGSALDEAEGRELRLSDLELAIRLGEAEAVEEPLRELIDEAKDAGDHESVFRAEVILAALREQQGDLVEAISLLEAATTFEGCRPDEQVNVYSQLGRAYASSSHPERAVTLFEHCLGASEEHPTSAARYAILLSYALTDIGEIERASAVAEEALRRTRGSEDPYMRVRLHWSMARIAATDGRSPVALRHVREAISLLTMTEDTLHLGRAHLFASSIALNRGDQEAATDHLEQASRLLGASPSEGDRIEIQLVRAHLAVIHGDGPAAVRHAKNALAMETITVADRGRALAAIADGLILNGDEGAAEANYREAVELLEGQGKWREAANACRSWAAALRKAGRDQDALDVLERAAEFGLRLTSSASAARSS